MDKTLNFGISKSVSGFEGRLFTEGHMCQKKLLKKLNN
jgi:hypothetical protein